MGGCSSLACGSPEGAWFGGTIQNQAPAQCFNCLSEGCHIFADRGHGRGRESYLLTRVMIMRLKKIATSKHISSCSTFHRGFCRPTLQTDTIATRRQVSRERAQPLLA